MHKVIVFLCLSLALGATSAAQNSSFREALHGKSLREAEAASRSDGRPVLVYIYLKSCPACRSYEAGTLSDPLVLRRLKEDFHVSAFDAKTRETVEWRRRRFGWDRLSGMNGAVALLAKGSLSFPVTAVISPDGAWHQSISGDIGAEELDCLLAYASGGAWKSQSYDLFRDRRMRLVRGARQ